MTEENDTEEETLYSLFLKSYVHHLDDTAIIEGTGLERKTLTYSELHHTSLIVSQLLGDISGTTRLRCNFVGVLIEQNIVFPAVLIGILSKGFGFAVLDPSWPEEKQQRFLDELGCLYLIRSSCHGSLWPNGSHFKIDISGLEIFIDRLETNVLKRSGECKHSMAYAVQTSGSTGKPKTIQVRHSSIIPNIINLRDLLQINPKDVIFLSSPSTFDPSVIDIFLALTSGAKLLVTSKSVKASPVALLNLLFPHSNSIPGVSVLQMTPSVFARWTEKDIKETVLGVKSSLRVLLLGGEPCLYLPRLMKWKDALNKTDVYTIYGITEVSAWASIFPVPRSLSFVSSYTNDIKMAKTAGVCLDLGNVLTETMFEVRDMETGLLVSNGVGELYIGSYKRICEVIGEKCLDLVAPLYRGSGDVVKVSNNVYSYIGRKDRLVKRWGQRVSLQSVEHLALCHKDILSACCVWDEGRFLLSLIVTTIKPVERAALQRHFIEYSKGKSCVIPDEIHIVDHLPVDHHGKVNYHILLENIKKVSPHVRMLKEPNSTAFPVQEFVNQWCTVLGLQDAEQVDPGSTFVSLGGNSLLALHLSSYMEDRFGHIPDNLVSLLLSNSSFESCLLRVTTFYSPEHSSLNEDSGVQFPKSSEDRVAESSEMHKPAVFETVDDELIMSCSFGKTSEGFCQVPKDMERIKERLNICVSWKINLGKCIDASPLFLLYKSGLAHIIIGSHSGKFALIDAVTGALRWSILLPNRVESSACSSPCGQYVYIGCYDGRLYCIEISSGKILWHFQTNGIIKCSPVFCNRGKDILFGSYDKCVYCICGKTGVLIWKSFVISPNGSWLASPLVINETAFVCSLATKIAAVKTTTGQILWSKASKSPIFATPIALPNPYTPCIVVAEVCGLLHCLSASSGEEIWSWTLGTGSHLFSAPSCAKICPEENPSYLIMFGSHDSFLYCLLMNSKLEVSLHWKVSTQSPMASTPFPFISKVSPGVCHLVSANSSGSVFIHNLKDGSIEAQYKLPCDVFSSPVQHNSSVYVGCRDNHLYCLSLKGENKCNDNKL